ncbi:MAG: hypothetical protein ACJ79K_13370 [Gemmatimonadaceae bacterium]
MLANRSACAMVLAAVVALYAPTALAQRIAEPAFLTPSMARLHASVPATGAFPVGASIATFALDESDAPAKASGRTRRLQIAGGMLGAIAVGLLAARPYSKVDSPDRRVKGDEGYSPKANVAYAIGSFVGSTSVAYAIGRSDGSHGSLLATALGAAIPTTLVGLAWNDPYAMVLGVVVVAPLQGVGAKIGYQATRHP